MNIKPYENDKNITWDLYACVWAVEDADDAVGPEHLLFAAFDSKLGVFSMVVDSRSVGHKNTSIY